MKGGDAHAEVALNAFELSEQTMLKPGSARVFYDLFTLGGSFIYDRFRNMLRKPLFGIAVTGPMKHLDHEDLNSIADAVLAKLEGQRSIDVATHEAHHDFIDTLIQKEEKREKRKEEWLKIAGGWGIVAALSIFTAAIWQYLKDHIR